MTQYQNSWVFSCRERSSCVYNSKCVSVCLWTSWKYISVCFTVPFQNVPECMQIHELACSFMSLYAVPFFVVCRSACIVNIVQVWQLHGIIGLGNWWAVLTLKFNLIIILTCQQQFSSQTFLNPNQRTDSTFWTNSWTLLMCLSLGASCLVSDYWRVASSDEINPAPFLQNATPSRCDE